MSRSKFTENARKFGQYNLAEAGNYYSFEAEDLSEEVREKLSDYIDDWEGRVAITAWQLCDADVESYELPDANCWWENDEAAETLSCFIKEAPHYLVFACNCRWDGTSGYKFVHDVGGLISRGYDVSIYPRTGSAGGKVLICTESSHDVPTGATTIMIALTENEYERLSGSCFMAVRDFAIRHLHQTEKKEVAA